ncbi:MAG TPA: hypothetical protein VF425_05375 [Thermoanaerobaculia bacterium]
MHRLRQVSAALLLALVAGTAVLPLAAASAGRRGCLCLVKMGCCEGGTCTMGGNEPPATRPEWRTCQREAPAVTPTNDAFERALANVPTEAVRPSAQLLARVLTDPFHARIPSPSTPPPRFFSF